MKKWYHEKKENAKRKYLQGYYPKHFRTPNLIVCWLYEVGYFFGDFVPLVMNLIEGIYQVIRRIVAFVAILLIEASTGVVLLGTIAFSVFHSIEFLRRSGAVGGLEYVGVFMFEVVFISSTAMLTASLMRKEWPNVFSLIGFFLGIAFVLISNVTAMNPTWEGWAIGIATPILLIISEGILAFQFMRSKKELKIMPELDETESKKSMKQNESLNNQLNGEQAESEQTESKMTEKIEQNSPEQPITEQEQNEQENKQNLSEQTNIEQNEIEQSEQEKVEQNLSEQTASGQTKNEQNEQGNIEQSKQSSSKENQEENNLEPNKETTENERSEQEKNEQENDKSSNSEQNENEQKGQPVIEQKNVEQPNAEQADQTEKTEQPEGQKTNKKTNKKSNTRLRVVQTNKVKKGKSEQVAQYVLRLMKQNKEFTVRKVADKIGCSPSTAQKGINKAKIKMKQEA